MNERDEHNVMCGASGTVTDNSHAGDSSRRVLILIGHTGGGHLRAAEAIREALGRRYGKAVSVEIVDALGDFAPFPFNQLASFYPWWINRAAFTWRWGYRLTDGRRRARALLRALWPLVWRRSRLFLNYHRADVIVSVHPLTNHYLAWTLRRLGRSIPALTMVTDPVSVHPFWLSPQVDRCLVGSPQALSKALSCGFPERRVCVTGLPVNPCFVDGLVDQVQARRSLGWSLDRPGVLVLGGGEGMGHLFETARAIDAIRPDVQLAVVAGRNRRLQQRLRDNDWRLPVHVYGFVEHGTAAGGAQPTMPRLMSAADVLITKAGPGSLHEAFLAGLPLILSGAVPGQEEGNVRLVVEGGAGVWSPEPTQTANLVAHWFGSGGDAFARSAARSRALAKPEAAADVADAIWRLALTKL